MIRIILLGLRVIKNEGFIVFVKEFLRWIRIQKRNVVIEVPDDIRIPMENKNSTFGNFGERQEAESKDWGYYAHLSIYKFASQFSEKKDCLEIGCGTGYGSQYLADLGVKSYSAIDKDPLVIEDLQKKNKNIDFESFDLDLSPLHFDKDSFDFIFFYKCF